MARTITTLSMRNNALGQEATEENFVDPNMFEWWN